MFHDRYIALEGIDGAGKTALLPRLNVALSDAGVPNLPTRAPGGTFHGDLLRQVLNDDIAWTPLTRLLLFLADQAEHAAPLRHALQDGLVVLADRSSESTRAYHQVAGFPLPMLDALVEMVPCPRPGLVLLLDLPALASRTASPDMPLLAAVREAYLTRAAAEPDRFVVLDALLPLDELCDLATQRILAHLEAARAR